MDSVETLTAQFKSALSRIEINGAKLRRSDWFAIAKVVRTGT